MNANGDRVSDYSAVCHFRHELYRDGSMIRVYYVVFLKVHVWLHINRTGLKKPH